MVSLARKIFGVSAHLGNPPLQVGADDAYLAALRRSQYITAAGLLMYSQSEIPDAIEVADENRDKTMMNRLKNGWNSLNNKLKSIF
jgi:cell division protein FtsA